MENDFKLVIKGKAIVLIDWANIRNQQRKLGWEIDLEMLYQWLLSHEKIEKIMFFYGYENHAKSKKFLKKVENFGYEVITKEVKYLETNIQKSHFAKNVENIINMYFYEVFGKEKTKRGLLTEEDFEKIEPFLKSIAPHLKAKKSKCDFDVEITTEIMKHFDNMQTVILFSGDGDFAYPIAECLNHSKKAYIVSHRSSIGKEIWNFKKKNPKLYPCIIQLEKMVYLKKFPASRN